MYETLKSPLSGNVPRYLLGLVTAVVLIFFLQTNVFATSTTTPGQQPGTVLTVDTSLNTRQGADEGDEDYSQSDVQGVMPAEAPWAWHPISVVNEPMNGFNAIRKTYSLPPDINPAVISTEDFDMLGQRFTFAYVLQQSTSNETAMEVRQTVTIETRSRDLNDIIPNLESEIWYERDGFAGTLVLDIRSITSEVAGTSRHTSTATRQRTFPHLSSADSSQIPRTITDGGITFHLSNVDWQSNSMSAVDGLPVASSYTANATYTAQVTQTRTTGYTITAEYVGTVFRTTQGTTLFTAVFYGEPIIEIWLGGESDPGFGGINPVDSETSHTAGYAAGHAVGSDSGSESDSEPESASAAAQTGQPGEPRNQSGESGNGIIIALTVIGTLIALAACGTGGFFLAKHFLGYNVTVYSINGPREIVKAGKIKLDLNSPDPAIILDNAVGSSLAKTDRYIIQIVQRAIPKLVGKTISVSLFDKVAFHEVPESAAEVPIYEFEVNFSDDDDGSGIARDAGAGGAASGAAGYAFDGDD